MAEERKGNIFDEASRKLAKKKAIPEREQSKTQKLTPQQFEPPKPNPEIKEMFEKMRWMQRDLEDKIADLHHKSGMTYEQFKKYIKSIGGLDLDTVAPDSPKCSELEEKIWAVLGEGAKEAHKKSKEPPQTKPLTEKERKGKTIGARRNWIPMR